MFNPGMFGMSQEQLAAGKGIGQHVKMEIRKYRRGGRLEIKYILINPEDAATFSIPEAIDQLAQQLMWGHYTFFGMKGEMVDVD